MSYLSFCRKNCIQKSSSEVVSGLQLSLIDVINIVTIIINVIIAIDDVVTTHNFARPLKWSWGTVGWPGH